MQVFRERLGDGIQSKRRTEKPEKCDEKVPEQ
jgi:hypothetical protein